MSNYKSTILPITFVIGVLSSNALGQMQPISGVAQRTTVHTMQVPASRFHVTNYMCGPVPYGIAAGDFNGDGNLDVVTADSGNTDFGQANNSVGVLLNRGDGTFAPYVPYTTGSGPSAVAVGDFNGDKKLDIAAWNFEDGSVSILLGNGDGTFQPQIVTDLGTPIQADTLAVGDFNGDGKLDLAVTSFIYATVRVLLGNGDGTFQAPVSYGVAARATNVAVGDFNGDGILDLAVTTWAGNPHDAVSILLGKGDGTFQNAVDYAVDSEPEDLVVTDFNGDGKLDLAVANVCGSNSGLCESHGSVSVLLGNGDGTFKPQTEYNVGRSPFGIATADFNGDGKLDLAVPNAYDSTLTVLLGNGRGAFNTQETAPVGHQALGLVAGKFKSTNLADVILANWDGYLGDTITVILNEAGSQR